MRVMVLGGTRFIGAAIMNWPRQTNARIAPGLPPASRGGAERERERARARVYRSSRSAGSMV
jgi:hypothetical protein